MVVGTFFPNSKGFSTFGFGNVGFWNDFYALWGFSVKIWTEGIFSKSLGGSFLKFDGPQA
jgi:hypothetical protein